MTRGARLRNHRRLLLLAGGLSVLVLAAALYWFQPWKLWTNTVVHDQLPVAAAEQAPQSSPGSALVTARNATAPESTTTHRSTSPARSASPATPARSSTPTTRRPSPPAPSVPPAGPVELARGSLISHEHATSGTVRLVELPGGSRVLTFEGLQTSDGPALHVWLTDAPVLDSEDGWHVFDDGRHVDLGALKGNIGDQVYSIPADLDLTRLTSVSIWCQRFSVSFGAAELTMI